MDPIVGFLLGIVVKWLAAQGLSFLKYWTSENEAQLEEFIKSVVPGDQLDEGVWQTVKNLLPWLIDKAKSNIDDLQVDNNVKVVEDILHEAEQFMDV